MRGDGAATGRAGAADAVVRARSLGALFLAGATIGGVSLLLPHAGGADTAGLWSNVALAYLAGAALVALPRRVPLWLIHVALVAGVLLIARAVVLSGEEVSFYSVWFIWIGLYAFYFLPRLSAAAHVAFTALVYAATLVDEPGSSPVARWLTTVMTLIVAGAFIDTLVTRARRQATVAEESAASIRAVAEVAHELARQTDSAAARPVLCRAAARLAGADGVVLWEPNAEGNGLTRSAAHGIEPGQRALPFVGPQAGALRAFSNAEPVTMRPGEGASGLAPEFLGTEREPVAALWRPVMRDGTAVAVAGFYWCEPVDLDRPGLDTLTSLLAAEAAATLDRVGLLARLEAMARTDDLTGLLNRRGWQEELTRELRRARRHGHGVAVAMLDLDHFKRFNDERGHQAGDRFLKQAASAWSTVLRDTDLLARYGGEEFALALSACSPDAALAVVERVRAVTPESETCSVGVALWDGEESADALLGRADEALYEAKARGRDQAVLVGAA